MPKPYMSKGWTIEVKSWENDGDANQEKRVTIADHDDTVALTALIQLFNDAQIGNLYEPGADEIAYCVAEFRKWATQYELYFAVRCDQYDLETIEDEDLFYAVLDIVSDVGLSGGEFTTRALESWKVYYSPEDIHLNEVTKEFKKD